MRKHKEGISPTGTWRNSNASSSCFRLEQKRSIAYTAGVMRICCILTLALFCFTGAEAAPVLKTRSSTNTQAAYPWWKCMQSAIMSMQKYGAGGYSTEEYAKQALVDAFTWDETRQRPVFSPRTARPSFCSSAVWVATLSSLLHWETSNRYRVISPQAWQAMMPRLVKDGETAWGYANANGPGFALLIHRLGAGVNFTDWKNARPSDVLKIWWNEHIGGKERGHLVILVKDEGDTACVWSSHIARDGQPAGYGLRRIPKSAMKRVLFTRVTRPAAFNRAHKLPDDAWLNSLMHQDTTWAECVKRCGIQH